MTEQFLLRFGVNMQAVTTGLQKTSAQIKAWGASLVTSFKEHAKSMALGFAAGFASEKIIGTIEKVFEQVNEKIILIKRTMADLGVSSNFAQGIFGALSFAGLAPESATRPLTKFNVLIGQAKLGMIEARQKMIEWGLATKDENWNVYNLQTGIGKLRDRFHELNDSQKRSAMLADVMGKGFSAVIPILELTDTKFKNLDKSNFFRKLSPEAIALFQGIRLAKKQVTGSFAVTAANTIAQYGGFLLAGSGRFIEFFAKMGKSGEKTNEQVQEEVELRREVTDELEKQAQLMNKIKDEGKLSIAALAAEGRAKTGIQAPRYYGVSSRMREAMRIDTLERKAENAFKRGDDEGFSRLRGEAAQMRRAASWASSADQNPMHQTEYELAKVNEKLAPVAVFASEANKQMSAPK